MPTIKQQFEQARKLIKIWRYNRARAILQQINHPQAQVWLAKLDQLEPSTQTPSGPPASQLVPSPRSDPPSSIPGSTTSTGARVTETTLFCEACEREAGPTIIACPHRVEGACPYEAESGRVKPEGAGKLYGCFGIVGLLFLGFICIYFSQTLGGLIQSFRLMDLVGLGILLVPMALAGVFIVIGFSSVFSAWFKLA